MLTALFASRKLLVLAAIAIIVAGSVAYVAHLRGRVATADAERALADARADAAIGQLAALRQAIERAERLRSEAERLAADEARAAAADRARYQAAARRAATAPVGEDGPLAPVLRDSLGRLRDGATADPDGDPHAAADGAAATPDVSAGADGP